MKKSFKQKFIMLYFFLVFTFFIQEIQLFDIFLSQTSNLTDAFQSAKIQLTQNISETTINFLFKDTFYIVYDSYFSSNNYEIFKNWEIDVQRNLSINFYPEVCKFQVGECQNYTKILIKTQKINFFLTKNFAFINLIFDFRDSLLDPSIFGSEPCYNDDYGCCDQMKFQNSSNPCYINDSLIRSRDYEEGFLYGYNENIFLMQNTEIINLFSVDSQFYYSFFLKFDEKPQISLRNCSFNGNYFRKSIIYIGNFSNFLMNNTVFLNYNLFELYEEIEITYFSYIFLIKGNSSIVEMENSEINNAQFFIFSEGNIIIISNCTLFLRQSSTFAFTNNDNLGVLKLLNKNVLVINGSNFYTSQFQTKYSNFFYKVSIFYLDDQCICKIDNTSFNNLSLPESSLMKANNNISLNLDYVKMSNISKKCRDTAGNCLIHLMQFGYLNNITFSHSNFNSIQLMYDISFMYLLSNSFFSLYNCSFSGIMTSNDKFEAFFTFGISNTIIIKNLAVRLYYLSGAFSCLFTLLSYNNVSFEDCLFDAKNSLSIVNSGVLYVTTSNTVNIFRSIFVNFQSFSMTPVYILNSNTITFFNSSGNHIISSVGGFFLTAGADSNLYFNFCIFNDISSYLEGGFGYLMMGSNKIVLFSTKLTQITSYSQGGVFYMQGNHAVYIIESYVYNILSSQFGGLASCTTTNFISIENSTINSAVSISNGAVINAIDHNQVIMKNTTVLNCLANGQGGIIYGFTTNIFYFEKLQFLNISSENEAGGFFIDNINNITFHDTNSTFFRTNTEGGFLYSKQNNNIIINSSNFSDISSEFSGGLIKCEKLNNIDVTNSRFSRIKSFSDSGLFYLDFNNSLIIENSSIKNVSALRGGGCLAQNNNSLKIFGTNFSDMTTISQGSTLFVSTSNLVILKNCNFLNIQNIIGGGAGFYAYAMNIMTIELNEFSYLKTEKFGAVGNFYQENILFFKQNLFNNCIGVMGAAIIYGQNKNQIIFYGNSILMFSFAEVVNLKNMNWMNFSNNVWSVKNSEFSNDFCLFEDNNEIYINYDIISFIQTINALENIFYLKSSSKLFIIHSTINIEKTLRFFTILSQSYLNLSYFQFNNFSSNSTELFYSESSKLFLNEVLFVNISISNIFTSYSSDIKIRKNLYLTRAQNSYLFTIERCNLTIISSFFKRISNDLSFSARLLQGSLSNISILKTSILNFATNNNGSIGSLISSNLHIVKTLIGLNQAYGNGGAFSFIFNENSNVLNVLNIKSTILFRNKAKINGGCFNVHSNTDNLQVQIDKSYLSLNQAFLGGAFFLNNLKNITITNNKFTYNKAKSNSHNRSKGGVFYFLSDYTIAHTYDYRLNIVKNENRFLKNKAEIGGVSFFDEIDLNMSSPHRNYYINNQADFYGTNVASDISQLRFESLSKNIGYWSFSRDFYFKGKISNLKSGENYTYCLLKISGYDRFNSLAYNTDEDLLSNLQITQINPPFFSNELNLTQKNGYICFEGVFSRKELPLNQHFIYQITSPKLQRLPVNKQNLTLSLDFDVCDVGDRLTEDFKCVPCEKDTYSFQSDFTFISEVCKSCVSEKFYCYGGGNYTSKPGYWRANSNSYTFYLCPNQNACLGDPRNFSDPTTVYLPLYSASYCDIGYTGVLCATCEDGYGFLDGHLCSSCENRNYYLQIFGNILLRLLFTIYLIKVSINMSLSIVSDHTDKKKVICSNLLKIFVNHMQILGFVFSLPVSFPKDILTSFNYFLSISPNLSEAFSMECVLKYFHSDISLQYYKLVVSGIYPIGLVILFLLFVKIVNRIKLFTSKRKEKNTITNPLILHENKLSNKDLIFAIFNLVLLICYADIAKMTMAMFGCVTIDEGSVKKKLLYADFKIDCDSSYHLLWVKQTTSPIIIFFLFLYPIYIIISMYAHKQQKNKSKNYKFIFSYFYFAYEEKFFFWDFLILLRKLALIFINAFFFSRVSDYVDNYPLIICIFIFALAFGFQIYCQPFRDEFKFINKIEECSLLATFYTVVIAFIYMISPNLDTRAVVGFLFIGFFLNCLFFVLWIKFYVKNNRFFHKLLFFW